MSDFDWAACCQSTHPDDESWQCAKPPGHTDEHSEPMGLVTWPNADALEALAKVRR